MCAKSKRSSPPAKGKPKKIDARFAAAVLTQACEAAAKYQIIVQFKNGEWYGRGLEMPQVFGDGATREACIKKTRDALTAAVAYLIESSQRIPAPAKDGCRVSAPSLPPGETERGSGRVRERSRRWMLQLAAYRPSSALRAPSPGGRRK